MADTTKGNSKRTQIVHTALYGVDNLPSLDEDLANFLDGKTIISQSSANVGDKLAVTVIAREGGAPATSTTALAAEAAAAAAATPESTTPTAPDSSTGNKRNR